MKKMWVDKIFLVFLCVLTPAIYVGCQSSNESIDIFGPNEEDIRLELGRQLLIDHKIEDAHLFYKRESERTPASSNASVGFGITSFLLLPYDPAVTKLIQRLGGKGALNAKRDIIYGNNGFISLYTQGTPIEDQGGFSGIGSLLGPDLPWTAEELNDPNFLNNIDVDFQEITNDFVEISDALLPIIEALETGINDSKFRRFELPGEVFFNEYLTLSINRADLAFAVAALRGVRALTLFIAAYDHPYKVSDFGSQWSNIDAEDPRYKEGYLQEDYILEFLDPKLFRTIQNPGHFLSAGKETKLALQSVRKALQIAIDAPRFGALAWNESDQEVVVKASTFIQALENAIDKSTKLPFIEPSLSLNMSVIFKDGRTLDPQIPWFTFSVVPPNIESSTSLNQDVVEPLFEGLFTPRLEDLSESTFAEADAFSELGAVLFGRINDDFNSSFGN